MSVSTGTEFSLADTSFNGKLLKEMEIKAELLISMASIAIGTMGSWIAFQSFQSKEKEGIFRERERLIIADENIKQLKANDNILSNKLEALFRKFDERMGRLEGQHRVTHELLEHILEERKPN